MRVTVVGASGRIGKQLVHRALRSGLEVTAVIRDSPGGAAAVREWEEAPTTSPAGAAGRLRVAVMAGLAPEALVDAVAGRDAVLSALGALGRGGDQTVNSRGIHAVVEAMRATGTRRVVAVSAAPIGPPAGGWATRRVARPLLWRLLRAHYTDLDRMERLLRESGLDWTVVRPPRLTDGPATGRPQLVVGGAARRSTVSRADVADAMLRLIADPAAVGRAVGVARA